MFIYIGAPTRFNTPPQLMSKQWNTFQLTTFLDKQHIWNITTPPLYNAAPKYTVYKINI
jgi:hypothetical protein